MTTKETKVIVSAETSKYERGMRNMRRINAKTTRAMKDAWGGVKMAMAGVVALGAATGYGMKQAIDAASDLQEVTSKFGVVFKDQIGLAEKNAEVLVDSYAMSTREAKQYLSSIQDLLVPMGMASKQAGGLSNEIVKLSADLGSFNNLPTEKVMLDIQSALVGNFETMKKYGVVLNATIVQEKALAMGLAETKDGLNAGMKAQAAYALMVEGSQAAIGDMARTSGDYANQTKKLKANIEDMSATIGDALIPIVTDWVIEANKWFENNDQIIKQIKEFAVIILELTTTLAKATGLAIEYSIVWTKTWQALGLATSGQISFNEALTDGVAAIERFNEAAKTYSIGPDTKGWDIYSPPESDGGIVGGNGEGGGNGATDWAAEAAPGFDFEKNIEALTDYIETEKELKEGFWQWELEKANKYDQALIEGNLATNQALINAQSDFQSRMTMMDEQTAAYKKQIATTLGTALLKTAGASGKAIFLATKAFDIGIAIMSAHTAAAITLASLPYPYNIAAAAKVQAIGYWQAAALAATTFGQLITSGGGGGGGSTSGGTYMSSTVDASIYETTKTEEKKGSLTINIQGDFIGDEGYIELLVEKINEAVEDKEVTLIASNAQYAETIG